MTLEHTDPPPDSLAIFPSSGPSWTGRSSASASRHRSDSGIVSIRRTESIPIYGVDLRHQARWREAATLTAPVHCRSVPHVLEDLVETPAHERVRCPIHLQAAHAT